MHPTPTDLLILEALESGLSVRWIAKTYNVGSHRILDIKKEFGVKDIPMTHESRILLIDVLESTLSLMKGKNTTSLKANQLRLILGCLKDIDEYKD